MEHGARPLVSVCIPTFNYGRFLPEAIKSVLAQSFTDFELVVVDNASTDETAELMEAFVRSDPRIRFYRNSENVGIVKNFNRALGHAAGDYVKILCADDLLAPSALERSLAADPIRPRGESGYHGPPAGRCSAPADRLRKLLLEAGEYRRDQGDRPLSVWNQLRGRALGGAVPSAAGGARDSTRATRTCSIWQCGFICWSRAGWPVSPSR